MAAVFKTRNIFGFIIWGKLLHTSYQLEYRNLWETQGASSLTFLSIHKEGFMPIFSATLSYGKSVSL